MIDDLKNDVLRLRKELEAAEEKWHAAMVADYPFVVGDIVEVVNPIKTWDILLFGKMVRIAEAK